MAPLLESVVEPEIKLMDPPSPVVPEPPPIDTAPPAVAPEPPLRLNTPPSAELEAPADRLVEPPVEALLSPPSRVRSPPVPPDRASTTSPAVTLTGYKDVAKGDENALQSAVAQQPVSIAIEADKSVFQLCDASGIRTTPT